MFTLSPAALAASIDHTLLDLDASDAQIAQLCQEAQAEGFAAVCIYPKFLPLAYQWQQRLAPAKFKLAAVIDFPLGQSTPEERYAQATEAVQNHAQELDLVLNRELLRQKKYAEIYEELRRFKQLNAATKLILETSLLTYPEKIAAMALVGAAQIMMAKTSTGVYGKATAEDVALLAELAGGHVGIKASGGIRTLAQATLMLQAGATRLGTSHAMSIMQEAHATKQNFS